MSECHGECLQLAAVAGSCYRSDLDNYSLIKTFSTLVRKEFRPNMKETVGG